MREGPMVSYRRIGREKLARIQYVLSDIDGTLTAEGRFASRTLRALEDLRRAGIRTVLVSGGSAGTALHIIRAWPVDAVVTESGAMVYYRDRYGRLAEYIHPDAADAEKTGRIPVLRREIQGEFPEIRTARDQYTRRFDLAFDHHEDPPYLSREEICRVVQAARSRGASVRTSSIHINCWFGEYDKRETTERFFRDVWGIEMADCRDEALYVGDAPNDQAMFEFFPLSVGVADVAGFAEQMETLPAYITEGGGGRGFSEMIELLLDVKKKLPGC